MSSLMATGPRALGEHDPEGVDPVVQALDPLQAGIDQIARRDLALGDHLGLAPGTGEDEIGGIHGREN
jgi:hypothetical protein